MIKRISAAKSRDLLTSTDPITKLSKDMKDAAKLLGILEARYLVKSYYTHQRARIRGGHLVDRCIEAEVPTEILQWMYGNLDKIETDVKNSLGIFAAEYSVGEWLQGITGIGGVLSAGLLTTFDIRERLRKQCTCADKHQDQKHGQGFRMMRPIGGDLNNGILRFRCTGRRGKGEKDGDDDVKRDKSCRVEHEIDVNKITVDDGILIRPKTASAFYRFAGLDPEISWESGQIRPWSEFAKTLCYKLGESWIKTQNNDSDFYGHLFAQRKEYENAKNLSGDYEELASERALAVGKGTLAYKYYSDNKLPPAHINARSRRWAVKMFLSHFHDTCYRDYYGEAPPVPFVFSKAYKGIETHTHYIPPPEFNPTGKSLRRLYGEI